MADPPKFPLGMRMAQEGDEERIYALFMIAHAENGMGDVDETTVRAAIVRGCMHDGGIALAVVDGPERIEAVIGLHPERRWYSTAADPRNWYSADLLIYVHPLHRRSRHAVKLFQFAIWWQHETKIPVVLGLLPKDDLDEKERLFERYGRKVGSLYLIGDSVLPWASASVGTA